MEATLRQARDALATSRFEDARAAANQVLARDPANPAAKAILGAALGFGGGDAQQAILLLEEACATRPVQANWLSNLAGLYRRENRLFDALTRAREAVALEPGQAVYHLNLARILLDLDDEDAAQAAVFAAIARDRHHAESHMLLGEILLRRGGMRPGFRELDWIGRTTGWFNRPPPSGVPEWSGMRLPKGRLLILADQGFGDVIQYARFIPIVAERVHEIVVMCDPVLIPLLARSGFPARYMPRSDDPLPATGWTRLSRLPLLMGTDLTTIPSAAGYLSADPARAAIWRRRLQDAAPEAVARVGLSWAGNPRHGNDHRRSIPLATLAPLTNLDHIQFVALQREIPARDRARAETMANVLDVSAALNDFGETAAAIDAVDLVIGVDSAVVHLAGAMGKPTWVMPPHPADWRWLLERTDSPWYRSSRLFRQPRAGGWASVVDAVAGALAAAFKPA